MTQEKEMRILAWGMSNLSEMIRDRLIDKVTF